MLSIFRISLSLICVSHVLFSADSSRNNEPISLKPYNLEIPNQPQNHALEKNHEKTVPDQTQHWSKEEIQEMETVFESSPEKAQSIVKRLENTSSFTPTINYRAAYFTGEPGTGKTVMAKAIAYKMTQKGWKYKFISSPSLLRKGRNSTAQNILHELEKIESSNEPTILIIDELNKLLENANNKNYDTDLNATALWTFLDKHAHNKNFFLIGTMNRTDKLPQPVKDRMTKGFVSFPLITNSKIKNKYFRKNFMIMNIYLEQEITDDFLNKELEKMGACSGRDIKLLSEMIVINEEDKEGKTPSLIKRESISRAINEFIEIKATIKYGLVEKTDEERQDGYHRENQELQEKLNHENQQIQAHQASQQSILQALFLLK